MYVYIYIYIDINIYIYTYIYSYIHIYIHIYTHIYLNIYIYIYIYNKKRNANEKKQLCKHKPESIRIMKSSSLLMFHVECLIIKRIIHINVYLCVCARRVCIHTHTHTHIYIYIYIIIIMSRYQHVYFWHSLATPPYRPLPPAGLPGYIQYLHRAAVCMFELDVLHLVVPVKLSTGVHHLQARSYYFSSVPHVWFV